MAITIDITVSGSSANSYSDLAGADSYFETHAGSSRWAAFTDDQKNAGLVHGARMIDSLNFSGEKYDSIQTMQFPRRLPFNGQVLDVYNGAVIIPVDIVNANREAALWLLEASGLAEEAEMVLSGVGSMNISGSSMRTVTDGIPQLIGPIAAVMVRKYINLFGTFV